MQVIQSIRQAIFYCIGKEQQFSLDGLPVEIVSSISDLLSNEDIYCLSLSNSRLFTALKRQRKQLQQPIGVDKLRLLHRIGRDLPNYFVCYFCLVLHKYDRSGECSGLSHPPFHWFFDIPCVKKRESISYELALQVHGYEFHTRYMFYFVHLQLAMRRFYYGPKFGITTESLSYTEVIEYNKSLTLFSTEAQICPGGGNLSKSSTRPGLLARQGSPVSPNSPIYSGETLYSGTATELWQPGHPGGPTHLEVPNLCLRMQAIMVVAHKELYLSSPDTLFGSSGLFHICAHMLHSKLSKSIRWMVKSYTAGKEATDCYIATICKRCNTDYELQLVECGQDGLALVITRWINLGSGLSPDDPQWKVHTFPSFMREPLSLDTRIPYISPRRSFETSVSKNWSAEALCSYNLSFLRDRKYKALMGRQNFFCKSIWSLASPQEHIERVPGPISQSVSVVLPCHKEKLE